MLSIINKTFLLHKLLESYPEIIEVYVDKRFNMECESGRFLFYVKHNISNTTLLARMQELFEMPIYIDIVVGNPHDIPDGVRLLYYNRRLYES